MGRLRRKGSLRNVTVAVVAAVAALCGGGCVTSRSDRVNGVSGPARAQTAERARVQVGVGTDVREGVRAGEGVSAEVATFAVPAERYAAVFDAVREVLKAQRFELDRVDARGGVITTLAKQTAGFATPWDTEQSSLGQEWSDLINPHQRKVRVEFVPVGAIEGKGVPRDLLVNRAALEARVEVEVELIERPGWRLDTRAVRFSTYTYDSELMRRRVLPSYETPAGEDKSLAERIVRRVRARTEIKAGQ